MTKLTNEQYDVMVIGGGPAGQMAAIQAADRGKSVVLLEKNTRLGKKLSITGGGRCNVTNNKTDVRTMLSEYKTAGKFLFSTFTQHGVVETIQWFKNRGVTLHEENEGRLFPTTNSAETICQTLESELEKAKVTIKLNSAVASIEGDNESGFIVKLTNGQSITAPGCVLATGGQSRPDTGSTGDGFAWLEKLGHQINVSDSALVPVATEETWVAKVSGVTLPKVKLTIYADDKKQSVTRGKLLFTHFGLSGPTILNLSRQLGELLQYSRVTLKVDLFPDYDEGSLRNKLNDILAESSNRKVKNIMVELIPRSLSNFILDELKIEGDTPGHSLSKADRSNLVQYIKNIPFTIKKLMGLDQAVVTSGGVQLTEINFKTMESKLVPGLYLTGDLLDIDRPSGGYSLQLCWSTGWVAGNSC